MRRRFSDLDTDPVLAEVELIDAVGDPPPQCSPTDDVGASSVAVCTLDISSGSQNVGKLVSITPSRNGERVRKLSVSQDRKIVEHGKDKVVWLVLSQRYLLGDAQNEWFVQPIANGPRHSALR